MATDYDTPSNDSNLCLGMVSRRTLKKLDESSPWYWVSNIRFGSFSIHRGLVGSPQGKDEEEITRAIEGHGQYFKHKLLYSPLTQVVPPLDWSFDRSSRARTNTPRTYALRISSCPVCTVCVGRLRASCHIFYFDASARKTRPKRLRQSIQLWYRKRGRRPTTWAK